MPRGRADEANHGTAWPHFRLKSPSSKNRKAMPLKSFTRADEETKDSFMAAKSKALGNLHERMKWLITCTESLGEYVRASDDDKLKLLFQTTDIAVVDLETEVSYTKPAKPPYGRRPRPAGHPRSYLRTER